MQLGGPGTGSVRVFAQWLAMPSQSGAGGTTEGRALDNVAIV
jgi:hypothetical protein